MVIKAQHKRMVLVAGLVVAISVLHYGTGPEFVRRHVLYRELYFIPVVLAAFWFGLRGGLLTSLLISACYLPFIGIHWQHFTADDLDKILTVVMYNSLALVLGFLRDRQQCEHHELVEGKSLMALGEAVASIAHDMKSPLVAIGGFSHLIRCRLDPGDPHQAQLNIIIEETRRLEEMVKDMLDFSKPYEVHPRLTDLNRLLIESLDVVQGEALRNRVALERQLMSPTPSCHLDSTQMKRVQINLLLNAIQASPAGRSVLARTSVAENCALVEISDCGCGIPENERERVFAPFFTTKKGGTGLGLPIARRITEAHGGALAIVDNQDGGITFRVCLPLNLRSIQARI